ncbi:MAG TPA: NAD-dependent epimerase/dehydratase family protein, partial [bacterium]|nr:NAD-dependent epimerase/dehydratase family protein [bacterium]
MIVVTGATGHVGNTLVRELNKRGIKPRIVIHEPTAVMEAVRGLDYEEFKGDTTDADSLNRAFKGADIVYNCAAWISITPGMYEKLRRVNVDGVVNVLNACKLNKVKRLVHVSSIEALGDPGEGVVATEEMG